QSSVWAQADWRGGTTCYVERFDPRAGSRYGVGLGVDPLPGTLRCGPAPTSVHNPASITDLGRLEVYANKVYCQRGDGTNVYESADGTTWSSVYAPGTVAGW